MGTGTTSDRGRRAARVTAVRVERVADDEALLLVTARGAGGDEVTRCLRSGVATIRHAAHALAHHYDLGSDGSDRWSARVSRPTWGPGGGRDHHAPRRAGGRS